MPTARSRDTVAPSFLASLDFTVIALLLAQVALLFSNRVVAID